MLPIAANLTSAQAEAIATADAHLNNVNLPTYSAVVQALRPDTVILWYVRCQDGEFDLLVKATDPDAVLPLWSKHFDLLDDALPPYIGPVVFPEGAGVIAWPSITDAHNTVHYKEIR